MEDISLIYKECKWREVRRHQTPLIWVSTTVTAVTLSAVRPGVNRYSDLKHLRTNLGARASTPRSTSKLKTMFPKGRSCSTLSWVIRAPATRESSEASIACGNQQHSRTHSPSPALLDNKMYVQLRLRGGYIVRLRGGSDYGWNTTDNPKQAKPLLQPSTGARTVRRSLRVDLPVPLSFPIWQTESQQ